MPPEHIAQNEVKQLADELCRAFADRDIESALALFATNANVSFFGSAGDRPHQGTDAVRAIIAKIMSLPETFHMQVIDPAISTSERTAWVATGVNMICVAADGAVRRHPYRLTLVLEQRDGRWLISHYHGSEPIAS